MSLAAAWQEFDKSGNEFWVGMGSLVEMLENVASTREVKDA